MGRYETGEQAAKLAPVIDKAGGLIDGDVIMKAIQLRMAWSALAQ